MQINISGKNIFNLDNLGRPIIKPELNKVLNELKEVYIELQKEYQVERIELK